MKLSNKEKNKNFPAYQYDHRIELGPWTTYSYENDPMHLVFVLSRYKFVAKMLTGKKRVLEVGCGDAIGLPIVAQSVEKVRGVDIDKRIIDANRARLKFLKNVKFSVLDVRKQKIEENFDAVYSVDVIEHIEPETTDLFMKNTCSCLSKTGICIVGTPNKTAEKYASPQSKEFHINLLDYQSLNKILGKYFENVFIFSMNDETIHTGFFPMAHYLFGMGVGKK